MTNSILTIALKALTDAGLDVCEGGPDMNGIGGTLTLNGRSVDFRFSAEHDATGDDCCDDCGDPFEESGPGSRSLVDPDLCEWCYTNPED